MMILDIDDTIIRKLQLRRLEYAFSQHLTSGNGDSKSLMKCINHLTSNLRQFDEVDKAIVQNLKATSKSIRKNTVGNFDNGSSVSELNDSRVSHSETTNIRKVSNDNNIKRHQSNLKAGVQAAQSQKGFFSDVVSADNIQILLQDQKVILLNFCGIH